jgi:serine-type D-Ala-D-Ala carboxypeptidase (penicillin-binding protein 5/6)
VPRRLAVLAVMATLLAAVPGIAAAPRVAAPAYIVVNPATGETLAQRAADRELPMASTTKIMTALIVLERADLDDRYTVPAEAVTIGGSTARLEEGEQLSVRDLLTGLLVASGNDAAITLADGLAGSQAAFVAMMNARAEELGLRNTHFANPHGLDAWGHYSTPFDLAIMLRAALNYQVIRDTMQTLSINAGGHELWNGNKLYGMRDDMIGGKTGYTEAANFCLAAAATRDGRFVIAVVTRDDGENWFWDVSQLLDWGLIATDRQGVPPGVDASLIGTQFKQQPPTIQQGSP